MDVASSSRPRPVEKCIHKNRLQEYAQRSALPLPVYQTISEGSPHALQFQSTVIIDGETFRSSQSFSSRKEAEQNVAKVALEGISGKIEQEWRPLIRTDTTFCKSILHEYAAKMNLEKPTYTCSWLGGLFPTFISSVSFAGKMYKGTNGRNKKEAQQLGARAVIESILGDCNSCTRTLMSQIIKSKGKLFAAINHINDSNISPVMHLASEGNPENLLGNSLVRGKEVQLALTNKRPLIAGHVLALPRQISEACPTYVEGMKPKEEYTHEINSDSIGNGTSLAHQLQDGPQAAVVGFCSHTINHIASNISPVMNVASEGNPENLSGNSLVNGKEVQSALTNERPPVAGHVVAVPSRQISEACPTHVEEMKPEKEYVHEINSGSIGSGTSLAHRPQDGPQAAVICLSSDTINHNNDSNISPVMHLASEGNPENLSANSLVRGQEVQSALTNERPPVAGLVLAVPSRQISEASLAHDEGMKPKEEYVHAVNSGSIGSGTSLAHQPQVDPQAALVSLSSDTIPDTSHFRFFSPVKNERCECAPAYCSHGKPSGLSTSPQVGPSRLFSATQEMSSNRKKKRSKKGKGQCRESKSKKSRTGKVLPAH